MSLCNQQVKVVLHAVSALGIADGFTYVGPELDRSCKSNQSRINNSQVRNNFAKNGGLVIKKETETETVFLQVSISLNQIETKVV